MQFVRDGKKYDTDTAEEIYRHTFTDAEDFQRYTDTLYRSPRGQYFALERGSIVRMLDDIDEVLAEWLEEHSAPSSAYEKAGIELEEG